MRSKQETRDLEYDRISDMPDDVLRNILSHMPTKDAVAASILSTKWGTLFPFFWIPPIVIDLDNSRCYSYSRNNENFIKFTDKLLRETLVDAPNCLDSLKLTGDNSSYDFEKIRTWVLMALSLNVRELSLRIYLGNSNPLFHDLNGCTTLTSLELGKQVIRYESNYSFEVYFVDGFTLPNLKTLLISQMRSRFHHNYICGFSDNSDKVHHNQSLNAFINCFPVLECLLLRHCELDDCLSIECPLLMKLTIENCYKISSCVLKIDAPKLKVLQYIGVAAKSIITTVYNFESLVSAHIDMNFPWKADRVEEFVITCSSIVRLYLSTNLIHALLHSSAKLPMFRNLSRLALGHIQLKAWVILAHLLCNSPNLEKLTFEQGLCLQEGGFLSFMSSFTSPPICLKHHVKEIEFWIFNETEDEIKLIQYFLNNGEVIQTIKLRCLPFRYKSKRHSTLSKLSMLPSQSKLVFQPKPKIESEYDH